MARLAALHQPCGSVDDATRAFWPSYPRFRAAASLALEFPTNAGFLLPRRLQMNKFPTSGWFSDRCSLENSQAERGTRGRMTPMRSGVGCCSPMPTLAAVPTGCSRHTRRLESKANWKGHLELMPSHTSAGIPRVLSLAQPTADSLHLGNFLGALRQWVPLQEDHEAFYGIADLHALTVATPPEVLRERILRSAAQLIAAGIDPAKATVFRQSQVAEHTQLSWVLGCLTGYGQAQRMTQFKDKAAKMGPKATNVGLFTYPVLMAADILLYQADQVPVGEDQRQHLELTRDLAARFNSRYGDTFVVPEPYILPSVGRIADLAEPHSKMSKSLSSPTGLIELLDDPAVNVRKIKSAVTDSGREIVFDDVNKPGVSNLLTILAALTGTPIDALVKRFEGQGYGDLKSAVADAVSEFAVPYRKRTLELMDERSELESILAKGADRAREVASATLADVYEKVGVA